MALARATTFLAVAAVALSSALVCFGARNEEFDEYFRPVGVSSYSFEELARLKPAFVFIDNALDSSNANELKQRWQVIEKLRQPKSRVLSLVGLTKPSGAVKEVVDMLLRARDDVVSCDGGSFVTLADIYRLVNTLDDNVRYGFHFSHVSKLVEDWIRFYRKICEWAPK